MRSRRPSSCPACGSASGTSLRRRSVCAWILHEAPGPEAGQSGARFDREEPLMTVRAGLFLGVAAVAIAALVGVPPAQVSAQQPAPAGVSVGDSDLGGVVTSANGPEAGVW